MNKLSSIFEMDPKKVPIVDFPISHTSPIFDFNQVCYNTAVEFVDGFNQDDVRSSKYGQYCNNRIHELCHQIGKNNKFAKNVIKPPIITPRPKFFAEGLKKLGNPEQAKAYCLQQSSKHDTNAYYCDSAYDLYKKLNKHENFDIKKTENIQDTETKKSDTEKDDKPNCTIVAIVSVLLAVLFIIAMVLTVNMLTTGVIKKK